MSQPVLQFGTSRFLQAHADLFISEALAIGAEGQAVGGITVVQTTNSSASAKRVAALAGCAGYPVKVRGLVGGTTVDHTVMCHSVREAWQAHLDWPRLLEAVAGPVRVILSNTGDAGFQLDPRDGPRDLIAIPRSFPAKLLALLAHRWQHNPEAPLSIFPCELIENNGTTLRNLVVGLAQSWALPEPLLVWLEQHCIWANSLVDRIVSEALEPIGAVAEPYALWAIER